MNVTKASPPEYTPSGGYINDGTAAGINALRRLNIKRCGELALRLSSRLTFAWGEPFDYTNSSNSKMQRV